MIGFFVPGEVCGGHRQSGKFPAIKFSRHARTSKNRRYVTGEGETGSISPVEKRLGARMISAAEEAIQPFVPDGERKIAQEKIRAIFAPLCISGQQELSIIGSR